MIITRISDYGLKISQGNTSIAVNPSGDKKQLDNGTFTADIVLLSAPQIGFDSAEHFSKDDKTFVISSAGEYEVEELFIYGVTSTTVKDGKSFNNTIYYFNLDGNDVCVLGAHEPLQLPGEATELVDNIDILIMPVTGEGVLSAVDANKIATKLEANLVIPMGSSKESDNGIQAFKDEFGHDWVVSEKINPKNDKEAKPQAIFLQ